jgi:hypothetical protein
LYLFVDQAEEVLTLNPGAEGFENRAAFFGFLRAFQRLEFASRIIVTLRTEYFGRFVDATQITNSATPEFQQFYLGDLSQDALIEAMLDQLAENISYLLESLSLSMALSFRENSLRQ